MSELINNSDNRKALLKHMILQLHNGEAPESVKTQLTHLLKGIPYDEVVEVEQELIKQGLPVEEVLKLCDIHAMVLDGNIDHSQAKKIPEGHPVDTFMKENAELEKLVSKLNVLFGLFSSTTKPDGKAIAEINLQILGYFNSLTDVDKHYRRKENLVFPFLEAKGITGPPTVMWGKHDETRAHLKNAIEVLQNAQGANAGEMAEIVELVLAPASKSITDMVMKENEILFPMTMDELSDQDWFHILQQTNEIGYCLYDPQTDWVPEDASITTQFVENAFSGGTIQLHSGSFSVAELGTLLNTLPVDITFVDKDDKVRFFTQGAHRIFDRNRAILGRDVRMCHPPHSMHIVDQILSDFKSGKESSAPFWIQMQGKFIYITYLPLRDKDNTYLGTIEFSQDLTALRALEGEQRLLSYGQHA